MRRIYEDSVIRITGNLSDAPTVVAAFAGVGRAFGGFPPQEEFVESLRQVNPSVEACFIVDKSRQWFTAHDEKIVKVLIQVAAGRPMVCIGSSMGAFGAQLIGPQIPTCRIAIGLAPQFSVDRQVVPKETRWGQFTTDATFWKYSDCLAYDRTDFFRIVLLGGADPIEREHTRLFRARASERLVVIELPQVGHSIAGSLKTAGLLVPMIAHATADPLDLISWLAPAVQSSGLALRQWPSGADARARGLAAAAGLDTETNGREE